MYQALTHPTIHGYCPMGCGRTLVLDGHRIKCEWADCPRPYAVTDLIAENQADHLVRFDPDGFTVQHPLYERLDDALLACDLHNECTQVCPSPGIYQAKRSSHSGRWRFYRRHRAPIGAES